MITSHIEELIDSDTPEGLKQAVREVLKICEDLEEKIKELKRKAD